MLKAILSFPSSVLLKKGTSPRNICTKEKVAGLITQTLHNSDKKEKGGNFLDHDLAVFLLLLFAAESAFEILNIQSSIYQSCCSFI